MSFVPKFSITPAITNRIAQLERIRALVDQSSILPQQEMALRFRAAIEATYSSTTIEGNPLNKAEVQQVLAGKRIQASQRAIIEVINYKKALDWIDQHIDKDDQISLRDVLTLHQLAMSELLPPEKVGKIRSGPVYIVDEIKGREYIRYTGPDQKQVKPLIQELLSWVEANTTKLHPALMAALLHFEFVSIHPFADGNGRVTRLLTLLFLRQQGYGLKNTLIPDIYYNHNKLAYYQALQRGKTYLGRRKADLTPWIDYFIVGLLEVATEVQHQITLVQSGKLPPGEPLRLSSEEFRILEFAYQMKQVTLQDVIDMLEVPKRTAQRRIQGLVEKDLLTKHPKGRSTFYRLLQ